MLMNPTVRQFDGVVVNLIPTKPDELPSLQLLCNSPQEPFGIAINAVLLLTNANLLSKSEDLTQSPGDVNLTRNCAFAGRLEQLPLI